MWQLLLYLLLAGVGQAAEPDFVYQVLPGATYADLHRAWQQYDQEASKGDGSLRFVLENPEGEQFWFKPGMMRSGWEYAAYLFFEPEVPGSVCVHATGYFTREFRSFRLEEKEAIAQFLTQAYQRHVESGGRSYHPAVYLVPMSLECCFSTHLDLLFYLCGEQAGQFELDYALPPVFPDGESHHVHEHVLP